MVTDNHTEDVSLADISDLVPHPRNPNTHPESQIKALAKIIKHQGWRAPIVVSKRSGFIIAGHGRLEAAKLLGLDQAPVSYQDFPTEADEWAHMIADNRLSELAEIDNIELGGLMRDLDMIENFDLSLTGFDEIPDETDEIDETDLSDSIISIFKLELDFDSEKEMERAFQEFNEKGYKCRILTL